MPQFPLVKENDWCGEYHGIGDEDPSPASAKTYKGILELTKERDEYKQNLERAEKAILDLHGMSDGLEMERNEWKQKYESLKHNAAI